MSHPPKFDESELLTIIDRLIRTVPGFNGGKAKIRQVTQRQERYRGGYDAVVTSVLPFYIQAKTSDFHPEHSTSDIIKDRKSIGVDCDPGAFAFYLRKHKGTTEPLQHNALYWLSLRSMAAYVCPTFLSEEALDKRIDNAMDVRRHEIWRFEESEYIDMSMSNLQKIRAKHFHGLVTIVPHRLVDHYLHRYSYNYNPNMSVVFHSDPEQVPKKAELLSEFINRILEQSQKQNDNNRITLGVSVEKLKVTQLNWLEELLDNNNAGLTITLSDISDALHVSRIAASTEFQRSASALTYLRKLDWLDLSAFFGGLLKEKYGVSQHLVFEMIE